MRNIPCHCLLAATLLGGSGFAVAEPDETPHFELQNTYALGIVEHDLKQGTEVTGWRLNRSWFVGHQSEEHGDDAALALVWQGERNRVSFSTEGIRVSRAL